MRWQRQNCRAAKPALRVARLRCTGAQVTTLGCCLFFAFGPAPAFGGEDRARIVASWYGEAQRGKLMANGKKFDPDRLTAASWFYALGTKVRVTSGNDHQRSVVVVITDRGPAWPLVRDGRLIDLSHAAFRHLAAPKAGLVEVQVEPVKPAAR